MGGDEVGNPVTDLDRHRTRHSGPGVVEGGTDGMGVEVEVGDEVEMGPVLAIGRLKGRKSEELGDPGEIEIQEEGSVKDQGRLATSLGVARELAFTEDQIRVALDLYRSREEGLEGSPDPGQDPGIGAGDGLEIGMERQGEGDGIVQATGPLHDGAAAGASAKDGDPGGATGIDIDFTRDGLAVADDDPMGGTFPEPEQWIALTRAHGVEGRLVPGEACLGCGPGRKVEGAHPRMMPGESGRGEGSSKGGCRFPPRTVRCRKESGFHIGRRL